MLKEKKFNVLLAVLATGVMAFSGVLIETAMNVTFPTLIKEFEVTTAQVQWVTTIYLLMISIIVPLSSYLSKNYSMRKLFFSAVALFILGVAINSLRINFAVLLLGRVFQGGATGIALPLMFNIILTKVPLPKRGMMIGLGTLTTSIAPALGPTYGGILTSTLGWPFIYILLLPVLLAAAVIGLRAIPQEAVQKTEALNIPAALSLSVMFTAFLLLFNYVGKPIFWLILIVGIGSAVVFYKMNQRRTLVDLAVFKNKQFSSYLFGFLVFQAMLLGVSFLIPNFMQLVIETPASQAGMMMFPGALIGAVFAPFSGQLLDKLGAKKPVILGLSISLIGWAMLTLLLTRGSLLLTILCHVVFMIGVGLAYSNLMTVGLSALSQAEQSDGNAVFSTLQQFTGAIATAFVALVISLTQSSANDLVRGTRDGVKIDLLSLLILLSLSTAVVILAFKKKESLTVEPSKADTSSYN